MTSTSQDSTKSNGAASAQAAVFVQSEDISQSGTKIRGPDFNLPYELQDLLNSYATIGFQASGLTKAIEIINRMRQWRLSDEPRQGGDDTDEDIRARTGCHIMLGFTSNLVSSGLREIIRFLVQHKYISGIVTTAGGVEEDLIKCLGETYLTPGGEFNVDGASLRKRGLNRIGNLIVPNDNYCQFEDWVMPILDEMVSEQERDRFTWSPSTVIARLGKEINNEESILFWASKNDIPIFCPALTDGSFGDMLFFHSYKTANPLIIDIVRDIRRINDMSMKAPKAGMIILGGGVCKHQIANSMLFRNGADFSVYINTGNEFDGSDSGARPDEAVSWGKIKANADSVKIHADATLIFPLVVSATWGKAHWQKHSAS